MSAPANGNLSREICAMLRDLLRTRTEWDEAPALYNMYWEEGEIRLRPIMPEGEWPSGPPAQTLLRMADAFGTLDPSAVAHILPSGFVGMVFRVETWGVHAPEAQAAAMLAGPRPSQRPDRIEQRFAWACTRDGTHYTAFQNRGEQAVHAAKPDKIAGNIPVALERAMHALTAVAN